MSTDSRRLPEPLAPNAIRGWELRFVLVDMLAQWGGVLSVKEMAALLERDGYSLVGRPSQVISDALRLVASGHVYLPREALGRDFLRETPARPGVAAGEPPSASGFAPPRAPAPPPVAASAGATLDPRKLGLTDRQCDVLRLILRGLPNKLICRQLDLAEGTVKVHVSAVLRALGVRNRTQAVIAASRMGLRIRLDAGA